MKTPIRGGLLAASLAAVVTVTMLGSPAYAGPPPVFQLPFPCGEVWRASTRADHKPNPNSVDLIQISGPNENPAVTNNSPIIASAGGRIMFAGWDPASGPEGSPGGTNVAGAGWYVKIDHGPAGFPSWGTSYLHMISRPVVTTNQTVATGALLGFVGSTGHSSGPHLHYQQWYGQASNTLPSEFNGLPSGVTISDPQEITSNNCGGTYVRRVRSDYNGDGKTDMMVYRPTEGNWYVRYTGGGQALLNNGQWGNPDDKPLTGDYNGDGRADMMIFRPSTGQWLVQYTGGTNETLTTQWGGPTDIVM
jgi:hypothetical protein